jgi:hypothetical protein
VNRTIAVRVQIFPTMRKGDTFTITCTYTLCNFTLTAANSPLDEPRVRVSTKVASLNAVLDWRKRYARVGSHANRDSDHRHWARAFRHALRFPERHCPGTTENWTQEKKNPIHTVLRWPPKNVRGEILNLSEKQ